MGLLYATVVVYEFDLVHWNDAPRLNAPVRLLNPRETWWLRPTVKPIEVPHETEVAFYH